ncbi:MAG: CCA tRNA nucleotidyltransferase [Longimicrobiales bacterium]
MKPNPPAGVLELARRLEGAGFTAWAVGGAVRNALVGAPPGDWDLATDAHPDDVRRIFRRTVPLGIEHGTVGVHAADGVMYEVTTFRRDVETFGRRAVVAFADTLDEDLARRDFTINAIAWHPLRGELRDPFGGLADLHDHRLRTVGDPAQRFAEDYLRVLRALRFAGHFRLEIEEDTWRALKEAMPRLVILSAERVREELWKVLSNTNEASIALDLYRRSGALATLYPELDATVGVDAAAAGSSPQRGQSTEGVRPGPEPLDVDEGLRDAWSRALTAVDALPPPRTLLRLAALLHGVGLPPAKTKDLRGGWRFTGHETIGARKAEALMRRLKASNTDTERVVTLVRHQSTLFPPDAPDAGVRRWLVHVSPGLVNDLFRLRIALWRADPTPRGDRDLLERWRHVHRVRLEHPPLAIGDLAISGNDLKALGIEPGPRFGEILRALLEEVIEEPNLNAREQLIERARAYLA